MAGLVFAAAILGSACKQTGGEASDPASVENGDPEQAGPSSSPPKRDGFGYAATGGRGGKVYRVTSLEDKGPGTLRAGAESSSPLRIGFRVSGVITLRSPIRVKSNKTIDGEGAEVTISKQGLQISESHNIIIRNLTFAHGIGSNTDAIQILAGAKTVLIDHCDFSDWKDGLVDITQGATMVTLSWNYFHDQDKVILIDPFEREGSVRVTLHHNFFEGTRERNPKGRSSEVHAYNNYLLGWTAYGMEAGRDGEIFSQANVFETITDKEAVRAKEKTGSVRSEGDLLLNGALVEEKNPSAVFDPSSYYEWTLETADSELARLIREGSGVADG